MKRFMLKETRRSLRIAQKNIPEEIAAYVSQLKLLYAVPFSYLVSGEAFLPAESMRFFCIDENWVNALVDGALSLGRNDSAAARIDRAALSPALHCSDKNIGVVRYGKVHENHRQGEMRSFKRQEDCQSGFILRSALTRKWKGLEVTGRGADGALAILRADMIGPDILLCIFDGALTSVEISEPRAGLRFGSYENNRRIQVKNIEEGEEFGRFLPDKTVDLKVDENGRLDVIGVVKDMKGILNQEVTPSIFAFELMLAAQKAVFYEKGGAG